MINPANKLVAWSKRLPAAVVLLALPAAAQMGGSESTPAATSQDPLEKLNGEFRSIYKQSRERLAKESLPVIICMGDKLVLVDKDLHLQAPVIPPVYSQLKVVDHVPLALFVLLDQSAGEKLDEKTTKELERIKELVTAVRPTLAGLGLSAPSLDRQYQLLDRSLAFLEKTEANKTVSHKELIAFCRELKPMIMQNVDQAVAAELKLIDQAVSSWREKLGSERFSHLSVVIVSGHMPRQRHTCFQYFARLLRQREEGLSIVYSEGAEEEGAARDLLATHKLDADIGETFFKEKLRMHRDLLSDGAAKYLRAHPPLSRAGGQH